MEMVKIVNPTLDQYMDRVRDLSNTYKGDPSRWFELTSEQISDEDDRDEFNFIHMALWERLLEREFFSSADSWTQPGLSDVCNSAEPGGSPGSALWDGDSWELINTQSSLLAC